MSTATIETSPGPLADTLGELSRSFDELATMPLSCLGVEELGAAALAVPQLTARMDAFAARVLDHADREMVALRHGHRRLVQFVLASTSASGRDLRHRVRLGRWLRDFGALGDAFLAGELSSDHLERLRRGLDGPRTHRLLVRDQQVFIDAGRDRSFKDFERVCDYWKIAADPDGDEPREQVAKTRFSARRMADGMVKLDGLLDPLSGQAFLTAWESELQRLAVADVEKGQSASRARRSAEALLGLVGRGFSRADGSHHDPLIHLVMSQTVAESAMRRFAFGSDVPVETNPFDIDGRCETIGGTPIHPMLAMAALGAAELQRVVMTADSRPLDVSYKARGFPRWLKHILLLRSRGRCESDGCDAPYPWLQADHVLAHSRGGSTNLANGQVLCRPHNLAKGSR